MTTLEVCIDNVIGLDACLSSNVERIELCSALTFGGLTPSAALIQQAAKTPMSVHVLIRPRSGDFYFNAREVSLMCEDISMATEAGVDGVVLGAANPDGALNLPALRQLRNAAGSLNTTLHRVIDTMKNPIKAMEQAIDLGFNTILSSGGKPIAADGIPMLTELHNLANGRIDIMAGAGLTPEVLVPLYKQTGITSFHSSCSRTIASNKASVALGFSTTDLQHTDTALIKQYQQILQSIKIT